MTSLRKSTGFVTIPEFSAKQAYQHTSPTYYRALTYSRRGPVFDGMTSAMKGKLLLIESLLPDYPGNQIPWGDRTLKEVLGHHWDRDLRALETWGCVTLVNVPAIGAGKPARQAKAKPAPVVGPVVSFSIPQNGFSFSPAVPQNGFISPQNGPFFSPAAPQTLPNLGRPEMTVKELQPNSDSHELHEFYMSIHEQQQGAHIHAHARETQTPVAAAAANHLAVDELNSGSEADGWPPAEMEIPEAIEQAIQAERSADLSPAQTLPVIERPEQTQIVIETPEEIPAIVETVTIEAEQDLAPEGAPSLADVRAFCDAKRPGHKNDPDAYARRLWLSDDQKFYAQVKAWLREKSSAQVGAHIETPAQQARQEPQENAQGAPVASDADSLASALEIAECAIMLGAGCALSADDLADVVRILEASADPRAINALADLRAAGLIAGLAMAA